MRLTQKASDKYQRIGNTRFRSDKVVLEKMETGIIKNLPFWDHKISSILDLFFYTVSFFF